MSAVGAARVIWDAAGSITQALAIARESSAVDGHAPFNDQMMVDVDAGRAHVGILAQQGVPHAAVALSGGAFELVVSPAYRRRGFGTLLGHEAIARARANGATEVSVWAHGATEAATRLAATLGLRVGRRIHILGLDSGTPTPEPLLPGGVSVRTFVAPDDVPTWVELNRAAFTDHPDQGSLGAADFEARMREPWFDPAGLFFANDVTGAVPHVMSSAERPALGYCWTKITSSTGEPSKRVGEIYALGVRPTATGRGIGRFLLDTGVAHLRRSSVDDIILYVESTNSAALALYESRGFSPRSTDSQYTSGKIES